MAVQFTDEAGNAMAAGVQVSVYPAGLEQTPTSLVGTDWTQAGGLCPNLSLVSGTSYIALFVGRQGPAFAQEFVGASGTTNVQVVPYRSPSLTTTNYATLQTSALWTKGPAWWSDAARASGGVAWALAYAFAKIFGSLDASTQQRLQVARIQSSAGTDVDSWAYDFLGQWLPRYTGESDTSFKSRVYAALVAPKTTLQAIQNIVQAYFTAISQLTFAGLAFDSESGSFDSSVGSFDAVTSSVVVPASILVWDRQSRPDLANLYNVNPKNNDGSFVIQLGYATDSGAWFLDNSALDYETFLLNIDQWQLSAPDPRLGALVNFVKAAGAKPLYLIQIYNP